jgi:hypothetical protein
MPHVGPVLEGRTFFCPHCGALYSVTHFQLSKSESNTAKCVVCLKVMDRWGRACRPLGSSWHPGGRGGCPWRPSSAARPPLRSGIRGSVGRRSGAVLGQLFVFGGWGDQLEVRACE